MAKLTLLTNVTLAHPDDATQSRVALAGSEVDVSDEIAERLVRLGAAEASSGGAAKRSRKKDPEPEAAEDEAAEAGEDD